VYTLADIIQVLAPDMIPGEAGNILIDGVCIDSRQMKPGMLFAALHGETVDGHSYVGQAFQAGAAVALVEHPIAGFTLIDTIEQVIVRHAARPVVVRVPDTLQALQRLAHARRAGRPDLRVVGITGSVGKTTTKEAVAAVLSQRYRTLKSEGNQNNEIGLPLTLMGLCAEHQYAVLEMGMYNLGEIETLCDIASPQIGVVTNVAPIHLERLGTLERIAQAKAELVRALPEEGIAILNGDDPRVLGMVHHTRARSITFGLGKENDIQARHIRSYGLEGTAWTAHIADSMLFQCKGLPEIERSYPLRLNTIGRQSIAAALAAVAIGLAEGVDWPQIADGLLAQGQGLRLVPKRGVGGSTLLDDSYNAGPASVMAALDLVSELPGRHLAVLGDMELGSEEYNAHVQVGQYCAQVLDVLVSVGDRGRWIAQSALEARMSSEAVHIVNTNSAAIEVLSEILGTGDVLLIKGSRSMGMESIVSALMEPRL
jgi:UDP-N-acetylmuramoyl-tripeptide--D-alanyl-D-alanine ligase